MTKHKDFDAFFREMNREPVTLTLFGEVHELPPSLPMLVLLKVLKIQQSPEEELNSKEVFSLAFAIFGEERIQKWAEKGLDVEQLKEMIKWATSVYMGRVADPGTSAGNPLIPRKTETAQS